MQEKNCLPENFYPANFSENFYSIYVARTQIFYPRTTDEMSAYTEHLMFAFAIGTLRVRPVNVT